MSWPPFGAATLVFDSLKYSYMARSTSMNRSKNRLSDVLFENRHNTSPRAQRNLASYIFEEAEAPAPGKTEDTSAGGVSSSQVSTMSLAQFIATVKSNQKPVIDAMLKGMQDNDPSDDKAKVVATSLPVKGLTPTQNEVVIDKSLPYTLQKPSEFEPLIKTDGPFAIGMKGENDAIITLNGKFVIDGHHRWSALFCFNPGASINVFDIQSPGLNPNQALIATQVAIVDKHGSVPSAKGGGTNLFTCTRDDIAATVNQYVTDDLAAKFAKIMSDDADRIAAISGVEVTGDDAAPSKANESFMNKWIMILREEAEMSAEAPAAAGGDAEATRAKLTDFIWSNVQKLQMRKPISGATQRELMPQADKVGPVSHAAGTPAALEKLTTGDVDSKKPYASESRRDDDAVILERWLKLAGIVKG